MPSLVEPDHSQRASREALMEAVVEAALVAQRQGGLAELVRQQPRLLRWVLKRHFAALRGSAGDLLDGDTDGAVAADWLLRWAVSQLRPDGEPVLERIDDDAWLQQTSWRPMLAAACCHGLLAVPAFPQRYHRRPDEPALDNLCGLWGVGPSTVYRYLEKARRQMAQTLLDRGPGAVVRRLSLRRAVLQRVAEHWPKAAEREAWHLRQAQRAQQLRDPVSALWHQWQAGAAEAFVATLAAQAQALADQPETDALVERMAAAGLAPARLFSLWLARAALARVRRQDEREQQAYEQALALAQAQQDRALLGEVYGALGKFFELRDSDRAFACYEDSAEFLRHVATGDARIQALYLTTLVRLAWLYVLRNDPRGKTVLDRSQGLRQQVALPDDVLGMLEQTWGEYWRRAGDIRQALDHKHRALNIFERLGDQRSVLATYSNLCLLYNEVHDFQRALQCGARVLEHAARKGVDHEMVASTHLNVGATWFWLGDMDQAIQHYEAALEQSLAADLRLNVNRAHFNLAEAYYKRFQQSRDPEDERLGDTHAAASLKANPAESSPVLIEATRTLKSEILGAQSTTATDRLLPEESAVHFEAMAEIGRQRAVLAVPVAPAAHVRARLAIARAYLEIAVKEREAALALARRHGLADQVAGELEALRSSFDRDLSRQQQLAAAWQPVVGDMLNAERRAAVLGHLLEAGAVNKSTYAQLCGLGLATASKHLVTLAERGLLRQLGKGPSTRYVLPD
jgi:tetratricopeptide (TPR) repeat protein